MLHRPTDFFSYCRGTLLGPSLSPDEVNGCNAILDAMEGAPLSHAAYALATAFHETNHTLQPVKELGGWKYLAKYDTGRLAAALGNTPEADGDGQRYAGRGYVQLTGRRNYMVASDRLDVDLLGEPDLALQPDIAAKIMRQGMDAGWFTGKSFKHFLPADNEPAHLSNFVMARKIINGLDRANLIAGYAIQFQLALLKGSWQ